ncbi:MAG: TlpA disulfide reductase family protein [Bacteroidota bacterium]
MKKVIFYFALLLFCAACQQPQTTKVKTAKASLLPVETPAQGYLPPGYPLELPISTDYPYSIDLKTADGKVVNSADVLKKNGKPSVVMFWLTTCYPCGLELNAIKAKFPQWQEEADFNLYAISTDFPKNAEKFVSRVQSGGWTFEAYHDFNRQFMNVMPAGLNGLPQVFVFDKKGDIVYHKRKYSPGDEDVLFAKVKELAK